MPLQPPHRVHTPSQQLRGIGLDVLEEQLVVFQEAVEDARVIVIDVSFLSQVQREVLGIFFSCVAGKRKEINSLSRQGGRDRPLVRGSTKDLGILDPCAF